MSHDDIDRHDDAARGDGRAGENVPPAAGDAQSARASADNGSDTASRSEAVPDAVNESALRSGEASHGMGQSASHPDAAAPGADSVPGGAHRAAGTTSTDARNSGASGEPLADDVLEALSAFIDGELPLADAAAVRERIAGDPLAAGRASAYRSQKAALRALADLTAGDGLSSAGPTCIVLRPREPWWWRAGIAAGWVSAGIGIAFAASTLIPRGDGGGLFFADDGAAFARRADVAYAVYSPERRHPVEVGAADEAHLVAWLSKRLGRTLSVPSLQEYGYGLVGGRLLPGASGPAAQLMYENDAGERLTLYVSAAKRDSASYGSLRDGERRTFYWVTGRTGYALSGTISEGKLRTIAADVCSALGGDPARW
ncbi:anti-sigma factor RsiW [Paraburkholderia caballeronis]|nr:anti-sigma factor RsiW [Paraburkholderia caballeronis]